MSGNRKVTDHPGRERSEPVTTFYANGAWWAQCGHGISQSTVSRDQAIRDRRAVDRRDAQANRTPGMRPVTPPKPATRTSGDA